MTARNQRIIQIIGGLLLVAGLLTGVFLLSNQRQHMVMSGEPQYTDDMPESFSFFDLDANTRLDSRQRRALNNRLGSSGVSHRGTVDLNMIHPGFLREHFPDLHELNCRINYPPRERVEHEVTRLMFRHTRSKQVPFSSVDLVFSNYNGRPFYFTVELSSDGAEILETLENRYGKPQEIVWNDGAFRCLFWEKNGDLLIFSNTPDRYGNPSYTLRIYFTHTIRQLLTIEAEKAQQRAAQRREAGKTAF